MTTSHDNAVVLISPDISRAEYVNNSFHITSGQPSTLPPTIQKMDDGQSFVITIACGRSASSSVANSFNSAVAETNHSWCGPYLGAPGIASTEKPGELNFYFAVNVYFNGVSAPVMVYLGQGNQLHLFNNWWIGGTAILNTYPAYSREVFFYVNPQKIYLIRCPYTEGVESEELTNTFSSISRSEGISRDGQA